MCACVCISACVHACTPMCTPTQAAFHSTGWQGPPCPWPRLPGRGSPSSAHLHTQRCTWQPPPPCHGHGASAGPLAELLPCGSCARAAGPSPLPLPGGGAAWRRPSPGVGEGAHDTQPWSPEAPTQGCLFSGPGAKAPPTQGGRHVLTTLDCPSPSLRELWTQGPSRTPPREPGQSCPEEARLCPAPVPTVCTREP